MNVTEQTRKTASTPPSIPLHDDAHEANARAAIERAFGTIPYYQSKGRTLNEGPLAESLHSLPLLFKKDLRATLPKMWVSADRDLKKELASEALEIVETSGSTEDRLRILWDKGWWLNQEARGMRTNAHVARAMAGEFGTYHESILTTPACGLGACHVGDLPFDERVDGPHLFLNTRTDPTYWDAPDMNRMLDELERHETVGLESDPAYLARLARHAESVGRKISVTGFTQLTYAFTTAPYLRAIRKVVTMPVVQLYGASEVGVLFMEGEDGLLHHCPTTTHVEFLPVPVATPGAANVALVVVTTLDRLAQPLVRFVVGDLVSVAAGQPSRFTSVPPISAVEGRIQDAIVLPDGSWVTCRAIDRAVAQIEGLVEYQVNQPNPMSVEVDVVGNEAAVKQVNDALGALCVGTTVTARSATGIAAEPSGKFRVVRRGFPLDWQKMFQGVALS